MRVECSTLCCAWYLHYGAVVCTLAAVILAQNDEGNHFRILCSVWAVTATYEHTNRRLITGREGR